VWLRSPRRRALHRRRARFSTDGGSPERVDAVARESWQSSVLAYLDAQRLGRATPPRGSLVDAEELERPRDAGRGVVLASAHLGAPELGARVIADAGFDILLLGARLTPGAPGCVRRLMRAARHRSRLTFLEPDLAGLREATRHLRRGGLVAILADVDVTGTGVEVDFLSKRASLPNLPVALALRTQAALVPCVVSRVGAGERCTVSFQPALELPRGGYRREALRLGTQLLAHALAEGIRAAPGQWFREARWLRRPAADTA
jgi:KDO2-lipid IV(A) lauroyltransferase